MDIEIGSNLKNILEQVLLATVGVSAIVVVMGYQLAEKAIKLWLEYKKQSKEDKKKDE